MENCAKNKIRSTAWTDRRGSSTPDWEKEPGNWQVLLSNPHLKPMFRKWERSHSPNSSSTTNNILPAGTQKGLAVKSRLRTVTQNAPRVHFHLLLQFSKKQGEFYILAVFTELDVNTKEGTQGETGSPVLSVCAASRHLCVLIYCSS